MQFPVPAYTSFTIPTGATSGARITFNELGDGTIRIYNSANNLVDIIGGTDGAIEQFSGTVTFSIDAGVITFKDGSTPGPGGVISEIGRTLSLSSGFEGAGGTNVSAEIQLFSGDTTNPSEDAQPRLSVTEQTSTVPANVYVSGFIQKSDLTGTVVSAWQTPTYNANWASGTTFNTIAGLAPLSYLLNADDTVTVFGTWVAGATVPGNAVFNFPAAYRPKKQVAVLAQRNSGGTLAVGSMLITTGGNFDAFSQMGIGPVASAEYQVNATFPLNSHL